MATGYSVSIVTPSYNQASFLEETIQSVMSQDYPHIEYIVIDGGSEDGSVEIIRRYEDRLAYWISEPDRGQADALAKGFSRATGEVLAYLNSDDLYLEHAVSTAMSEFARDPDLAFAHGDCVYVDPRGRRLGLRKGLGGEFMSFFLQQLNPIQQPSAFWRRTAYDTAGGINPDLHLVMDYDLWCRIGLRGLKMKHIAKPLSSFRVHGQSKTKQNLLAFVQERWSLLEEYFEDPDLGPMLAPHRRRILAMAHLRSADAHWMLLEQKDAYAHYRRMLQLAPRCTFSRVGRSLAVRFLLRRRVLRPDIIGRASR